MCTYNVFLQSVVTMCIDDVHLLCEFITWCGLAGELMAGMLMSAGEDHFSLLFSFPLTLPNAGFSNKYMVVVLCIHGRF